MTDQGIAVAHDSDSAPGAVRLCGALLTDIAGDRLVGTGSDWFPTVYDRGVFVDKSLLVRDVLMGKQAMLYCRPRRFGKTLAATMLKDFFECAPAADPAARARFERLAIWTADEGRWREHQGAYPVVMLSLKEAAAATWETTRLWLASLMAAEVERHGYLLDSDTTSPFERERLARLASGTASEVELGSSLRFLTTVLARHHGKPCMIIVDEYDAPITHAYEHGFQTDAVDFMRNWLSGALKTNPALAYGVLTGVQRVSKESIFSGLNNIGVNTPLNQTSDERFGFTDTEVEALATYTGHEDGIADLRSWYDGYRFGSVGIYNPWSVLSCLADGCDPQPYWANTSGNSVLSQAFRSQDTATVDALLSLLEPGATVERAIDPNVAYGDLAARPGGIWSVLYMAGYLTTDDTQRAEDASVVRRLRIPNAEVRSVFRREVIDRTRALSDDPRRLAGLHAALVAGDQEGFARELESVAVGSASMLDLTSEAQCHMLLMGLLFDIPGYRDPLSNREAGFGRFDVMLPPNRGNGGASLPLITIEVKFMPIDDYKRLGPEAPARLSALANEALGQIKTRAYDMTAPSMPPNIARLRWGVAFSGKHVACAATQVAGTTSV